MYRTNKGFFRIQAGEMQGGQSEKKSAPGGMDAYSSTITGAASSKGFVRMASEKRYG